MTDLAVLMPVHNGEKYLHASIDSILQQTYKKFRFIIVDDGSTDNTESILKSYQELDSRIVLLKSTHRNIPGACNVGLHEVREQFIARMDADDISYPDRFMQQIEFLRNNPGIAAISSHYDVMRADGKVYTSIQLPTDPGIIQDTLEDRSCLCHPAAMIRTSMLLNVGGYRMLTDNSEDYDLWFRLSEKYMLSNIPKPLIAYRVHSQSVSHNKAIDQMATAALAKYSHQCRIQNRHDPVPDLVRSKDSVAASIISQLNAPEHNNYYPNLFDVAFKREESKHLAFWDDLSHLIKINAGGLFYSRMYVPFYKKIMINVLQKKIGRKLGLKIIFSISNLIILNLISRFSNRLFPTKEGG